MGVSRRYTLNQEYFEKIDSEEKAYWLGFITADGSISAKKQSVSVGLSPIDKNHLEKLKQAWNYSGPFYTKFHTLKSTGKTHEGIVLSVTSSKMITDLAKHGVIPNKSLKEIAWEAPDRILQNHYWRGIFDGDGSVYLDNTDKNWRISFCGSNSMVNSFKDYVGQFGHTRAKVVEIHHKLAKIPGLMFFRVSGELAKNTLKNMYVDSNIYLDRKHELALKALKGVD